MSTGTMSGLDDSVELLKDTLTALEDAVGTFQKQTVDIPKLKETLHSKALFDVLPERIVLQRPLKIRKVVKPLIEKDRTTLGELLSKYKKKRQVLEQQSKILKLKLETLNN